MNSIHKELAKSAIHGDPNALAALNRLAESGDAEALFRLGTIYDCAGKKDDALNLIAARKFYLRSAELGHGFAQLCLGNMFDYGEGGEQDYNQARFWYEASAKQGFRDAQMHYGRMLQVGRGGPKNVDEAAAWYKKAVQQGDELAATNLGLMHLNEELKESDKGLAVKLLQFSAEHHDGLAHLCLGEIKLKGELIDRNAEAALLHFCIACLLIPTTSEHHRVALYRRESVFNHFPETRSEFEARALSYINRSDGQLLS